MYRTGFPWCWCTYIVHLWCPTITFNTIYTISWSNITSLSYAGTSSVSSILITQQSYQIDKNDWAVLLHLLYMFIYIASCTIILVLIVSFWVISLEIVPIVFWNVKLFSLFYNRYSYLTQNSSISRNMELLYRRLEKHHNILLNM